MERLDFVKADVEGAEARLLTGAQKTLARLRPSLLLELEDRHLERFDTSAAEIVDGLAEYGYTPSHWDGEAWLPGIVHRTVLFRRPSRCSGWASVHRLRRSPPDRGLRPASARVRCEGGRDDGVGPWRHH